MGSLSTDLERSEAWRRKSAVPLTCRGQTGYDLRPRSRGSPGFPGSQVERKEAPLGDRAIYSREEIVQLRRDASAGRTLSCPRCGERLRPHDVLPRPDVSYVRVRTWWLCDACGRSAVLDKPAGPVEESGTPGSGEHLTSGHRPTHGRPVVGWREWVALPGLGIVRIKAKVDTGARSSALHAVEIEEWEARDGRRLRFTVYPIQRSTRTAVRVEAPLVDRRRVRSSSGRQELRPVVRVDVGLGEEQFSTEVTLARRDQMGFRMLLGRTALRRRFLVDPGRSFLQPPFGS